MFRSVRSLIGYDTLSGKLRFWNSFLILLVASLTIVPFAILDYHQDEQEVHKQLVQTVTLQKAFIDQWLDERSHDVRNIAKIETGHPIDKLQLRNSLNAFQYQQQEFASLVYVNKQGITEVDTTSTRGIDVSERPYFQAAKQGREYVSDVLIGKDSGLPVIIFSAPVLDENNQFNGLIFGSVNVETIDKLLTRFRSGHSGETYLLNRDGLMLTESRFTNKLIQLGKVKDSSRLQFIVHSQITEEAVTNERSYSSYENYLGDPVYGTYSWINNKQWLLVGEVSKNEVFAPYYQKLTEMSLCVIFVLLFGGLILFNLIERIKQLLKNLQEGTHQIQEENYQHPLDPNDFKEAPIELKALYQAFNQMTFTIQNKMNLLRESETRYRQLVERSPEAIMVYVDNQVMLANQMASTVLGFTSSQQLIGLPIDWFIHPNHVEVVNGAICEVHQTKEQSSKTVYSKFICPNQKEIDVEIAISFISYNEKPAVIVVFHDITERKEEEHRLHEENQRWQQLSQLDGLIGIANRRMFDSTLEEMWSHCEARNEPLSLIMLDIDYFKEYNDTYGHQEGDMCLRLVAQALERALNQTGGFIARYGGEEFAIILPGIEQEAAFHIALNLRTTIEELGIPHRASRTYEFVTISLGVATINPTNEHSTEDLLHRADQALYSAKQRGRNKVIPSHI